MPDVTMCKGEDEGCPMASTCYRSPASGKEPDPTYQAWFIDPPFWRDWRNGNLSITCDEYWEVRKKGASNGIQGNKDTEGTGG